MHGRIVVLGLLLAPLAAMAACGVTRIDDEGGSGSDGGVPAPVQARLNESCAVVGCHVAGATSPDLSEASAGAWVTASGEGGQFVVFGDVANSYLVTKMMPNPPVGSQMPIGREILPEDMAVIVGWIAGVEFPTGDTDDSSSSTDPTMGSSDGSSGEGDAMLCSLDVVAPMIDSPVDAGDEAGKLPSSIGTALERNCGCHYSSQVEDGYFAYGGGTQLQTLENFTNNYAGGNTNYQGQAAWIAVEDRMFNTPGTPMPMLLCETEEGMPMTQADIDLFAAWFDQEAPDGATFVPPE